MTDKFKDITDDEILEEIHERELENKVDCDCSAEEEEAAAQAYLEFTEHVDDEIIDDIQKLCDAYQYDSEGKFIDKVYDFLVDHGGLIA